MAKLNGAFLSERRKLAFERLEIQAEHRLILCLDGGGIKGIMTIQLLKELERIAGMPCYELFDLVSGTSTGGIIASLIANGYDATQIESKYKQFVGQVFDKRPFGDRFIRPPKYEKGNFRKIVRTEIQDTTIQQACQKNDIDLVISAHDMSAAEETFFTCFKQPNGTFHGTYKDILLRSAIEATMSAPTYFYPLERFIDGGTTTYNNPVLSTIIEAITYSGKKTGPLDFSNIAYDIQNLTVFSFGTGMSRNFVLPNQTLNPKGFDIKFWLKWIMTATGQDASAMQVNTLRSPMINRFINFRRFQISLDAATIKKLPNIEGLNKDKYNASWLHDIGNDTLSQIDMADVSRFDLMELIGKQMAQFILAHGAFTKDLIDSSGRDLLVSRFGDIERIMDQMSDPKWIDDFIA
jgi:uncharacterized protein